MSDISKKAKKFFNKGLKHYNKCEYENAIENYTKAIKINSNYAGAYNNRGNIYYNKGEYDKAIMDYNEEIRLNHNYTEAYNNKGNIYYNKGEYDKAIMDYYRAIDINPNNTEIYYNIHKCYYHNNFNTPKKTLTVERIFHPVGQGAFYTEEFRYGRNIVFTMVYDCGSKNPSCIKNAVKKFLNGKKKIIDLLCISHFDQDHYNGVSELLENCEKIIVPLLELKDIALAIKRAGGKKEYVTFIYNIFHKDGKYHNKTIFVSSTDNEKSDKKSVILEELKEATILKNGEFIESEKLQKLWIFRPFNLKYNDDELRNDQIKKLCDKCISNNIGEYFNKYIEKLKNLYEKLNSFNKNDYSMTLYSGSLIYTDFHKNSNMRNNIFINKTEFLHHFWHTNRNGCLYTGDYNMVNNKSFNCFYNFYKGYENNILTLQIPHHGSIKNWNENIIKKFNPKFTIVSAKKNSKYHPDKDIIVPYLKDKSCFCLITEEKYSCVKQLIQVKIKPSR